MVDVLQRLPIELGQDILGCGVLDPLELTRLEGVCRAWHQRLRDDTIWRRLAMRWNLVSPDLPRGADVHRVIQYRSRGGHDEQGCLATSVRTWRDLVCLQELIERQFGQTLVHPSPPAPTQHLTQQDEQLAERGQEVKEHACARVWTNRIPHRPHRHYQTLTANFDVSTVTRTLPPFGLPALEMNSETASETVESYVPSSSSLASGSYDSLPGGPESTSPGSESSPGTSPAASPSTDSEHMLGRDAIPGEDMRGTPFHEPRRRNPLPTPEAYLQDPDFVCAVPEDGVYVCSATKGRGRGRITWTTDARFNVFIDFLPEPCSVDGLRTEEQEQEQIASPPLHCSKPAIDGSWLSHCSFRTEVNQWTLDLFQLQSAQDPQVINLDRDPAPQGRGYYMPVLTIPLPKSIVQRHNITPPLRDLGMVRMHYPLAVVYVYAVPDDDPPF